MNKITEYISNKTGKKVTNTGLLNTIREKASPEYKNDIPEFSLLKPINHNNIPVDEFVAHANEFFNILVNRIGNVVIKSLMYDNPLGVFRTETFTHGDTLEEIYVGLADEEEFNAKDTNSPFMYADTDIQVFYHKINREVKYRRTFEDSWAIKAFTSDNAFDDFINNMFISLMSSDEVDEYEKIKQIISDTLTPITLQSGVTIHTPATFVDFTPTDWVLNFNKELIQRTNLFTQASRTRYENAAGVPKSTPITDQYLLLNAKMSADIDSLLANAFNMNKASVLATKIVVDEFPQYTGGGQYDGAIPVAVLLSKRSIILKDKLVKMTNIFNPNTLSYNYWLHHHQMISFSAFENTHVYYTK